VEIPLGSKREFKDSEKEREREERERDSARVGVNRYRAHARLLNLLRAPPNGFESLDGAISTPAKSRRARNDRYDRD